jgi:hypothetical protein
MIDNMENVAENHVDQAERDKQARFKEQRNEMLADKVLTVVFTIFPLASSPFWRGASR